MNLTAGLWFYSESLIYLILQFEAMEQEDKQQYL